MQHPTYIRDRSTSPSESPSNKLIKARSTTDLNAIAAANRMRETSQEPTFRTLADPRNASMTDLSKTGSRSPSERHPDLSAEVSALSDKLVSAIEHNGVLDEKLSETRRELEESKARIAKLEAEAKEHQERLSRGDLLTKKDAEDFNGKLATELAEEKRQRSLAQQEKRGIETELETLTASLFDEANKMVAAANMQRDAVEKKNNQLRDQIKDGEALIASQTEQMTELKVLMQQIGTEHRKELQSPRSSVGPASPGLKREDSDLARALEAMNLTPASGDNLEIAPTPATSLTHLLRPECRTDVPAYDDFKNLIEASRIRSHTPSHAPSRAGSGNYAGLNVMGLSFANNSNPNLAAAPASKTSSNPSIPGSFSPNADAKGPQALKDTRFFKRIMSEDIEPTLRLDLSPTISWLNRRSIIGALAESNLVVEPIPEASMKLYGKYTTCAICGESRKQNENPRTHQMRVREGEGATKWSICRLCLEKVRGVGDLIAYVRMIREGVVKCGDRKEEEEAWEELVKMRERLFWARMAGGVVPAFVPSNKGSPTASGGFLRRPSEEGAAYAKSPLGQHAPASGSESSSPSLHSAQQSRSGSPERTEEEKKLDAETTAQLQQGLDDSLTTFDNYKEKRASLADAGTKTPPATPPRPGHGPRNSSGSGINFPKISIPKMPDNFWNSQVNTLH
ncbi:Rab guanine nucleotide exchange factor sec2 [Cyphellophora attinorum]|uniref:Rab guanine nucleotide exchange factor sec2 n=1 Tax=Cyphellophora attinorum TaxID=1664694 RepID=A0A0N0NQP3_9EURO|nr:Rab guanine nucleotide exchange factor sec2 [Phialophora attinorum]KPI44138.1 Rab guanine nucleotide exchange factor sec2 [Phialophora attinorum]